MYFNKDQMSTMNRGSESLNSSIKRGQKLPGLRVAGELKLGEKHSQQRIPSEYGELTYDEDIYLDGHIRWRSAWN